MSKNLAVILLLFSFSQATGQTVAWEKRLNGSENDVSRSMVRIDDALFIVSYSTSQDIGVLNKGGADIIVSKVGPEGEILWNQIYGGSGDEDPYEILDLMDGNILVVGTTDSDDGNFSKSKGGNDGFAMKINQDGDVIWTRQLGGTSGDYVLSCCESRTGNIYLAGITESSDNGMFNHGLIDGWMVKISMNGDLTWQKSFGGTFNDVFMDVTLLHDTMLVACGRTRSGDQDIQGFIGNANSSADNGWIVQFDTLGMLTQQRCFGNSDSLGVSFNTIHTTQEDRILVAGEIGIVNSTRSIDNYSLFLAEYSSDLTLMRHFISDVNGRHALSQIVLDGDNNTYLIGSFNNLNDKGADLEIGTQMCVVKLDQDLVKIWSYYSELEFEDRGLSGAIDKDGNLMVCGERYISNGQKNELDAFYLMICTASTSELDIFLCQGDSIEIGGVMVFEEGIYYDTLSSIYGCDSIIEMHLSQLPSYNFEINYLDICNSDLILHDSVISEAGSYTFSFLTEFNCDSTYTYAVGGTNLQVEVDLNANSLTAVQPDAAYQWYDCDKNLPIVGATDRTFYATRSGGYKVMVDFQGCIGESECFKILNTSTPNDQMNTLKVYPNPFDSFIRVDSDVVQIRSIQITDITGSNRRYYNCSGGHNEIELSYLPRGIYLLKVETDRWIITKRLVKF